MRTTASKRPVGGYVMVLLAMMLFGLFAMAALVIDIGFARLAQRQMQSAADSAALEGARNGDEMASELVGIIFDDDLDTAADPLQFGAGPIVTLTDSPNVSNAALVASQDLSVPAARSYKPDVQAGPGVADGEYQVILQRGNPIDASFTPNLRAQGPPIEFLFGRGSLLPRNRIREGISVGAISRTRNEPVIFIGASVAEIDEPAFLPFAVSIDDWLDEDTFDSDGVLVPDTDQFFANESRIVGEQVGGSLVPGNLVGRVAIFSSDANNRVIGFGLGTIMDSGIGKQILPSPDQVATANVSATPSIALPEMGDDANAVFSERSSVRQSLLVTPVLVRN